MNMNPLTILSFGGGQDSTAILLMLLHERSFREKYAPGDLIVVMSDTGNEHPSTVRHVKHTRDLCAKHGVPFFHLTPDLGFHSESAPDLISYWRKTNSVGSKMFAKTCSDRLKIRVIYKFIDHFLANRLGIESTRKAATKIWMKDHGKIQMLVGIAKGEEGRVSDPGKVTQRWMETFDLMYPLIDLGMDRKSCQDKIRDLGHEIPFPSNCMLCPFMNDVELLWLKRFHPEQLEIWIDLESNKIQNNLHMGEKNFGVWKGMLLPQKVEQVEGKYGHMTDDELNDYKFSHGHCVKSKF
jgi:hypothetical protein